MNTPSKKTNSNTHSKNFISLSNTPNKCKRKVNNIESNNNNQKIKSLDEQEESNKELILVEDLEQLYFGRTFNSDLKIIYDSTCVNLHSQILANYSEYFYNLLENQEQPYETIELPILQDVLGHTIPIDRMKDFFEVIYSSEPLKFKDLIYFPSIKPEGRYNFCAMAHLSHYFQCDQLEKQ